MHDQLILKQACLTLFYEPKKAHTHTHQNSNDDHTNHFLTLKHCTLIMLLKKKEKNVCGITRHKQLEL